MHQLCDTGIAGLSQSKLRICTTRQYCSHIHVYENTISERELRMVSTYLTEHHDDLRRVHIVVLLAPV